MSYNGWSNYETWRVNLEILGDIQWDDDQEVTVELLEEIVENVVFDNSGSEGTLVADYARGFLQNVNYGEILETIQTKHE